MCELICSRDKQNMDEVVGVSSMAVTGAVPLTLGARKQDTCSKTQLWVLGHFLEEQGSLQTFDKDSHVTDIFLGRNFLNGLSSYRHVKRRSKTAWEGKKEIM